MRIRMLQMNYNKDRQDNTAYSCWRNKKSLEKFLPIDEGLTVKHTTLSFLYPEECIKSLTDQFLSIFALRKHVIADVNNLMGKRPEQMLNKNRDLCLSSCKTKILLKIRKQLNLKMLWYNFKQIILAYV